MPTFLEDVRKLALHGDHEAALELADLWLDEYPHDLEARLLKAQICLNGRRNYGYVGQILLDFAHRDVEGLDALRRQSAEVAWSLVGEGRERLRSRAPDEALQAFENATALLPTDGVIPLAAGLALTRVHPAPPANPNASPFAESRRRLNPATLSAQIELYLRRAIDAAPDARAYEVAVTTLVRHWLSQDRLTTEALSLLARVDTPSLTTLELLRDAGEQVVTLVSDTIANLLRIGMADKADLLLNACRRAKVRRPRLALLEAERHLDQPEQALKAYQRVLAKNRQARRDALETDAARSLLLAVQGIVVKCPACGKATRSNESACVFCETPLVQHALRLDAYPAAPDAVLAHAGIAELLAGQGELERARASWQAAVDALPPDHSAQQPLRALYRRLFEAEQPPVDDSAARVLELMTAPLGSDLLHEVRRVNEHHPDAWVSVPSSQRARLVRLLIETGQLKLAGETLSIALADRRGQAARQRLQVQLDDAISVRLDEALRETRERIAAGRSDEAVTLATGAISLRSDPRLLRARGDARLATGCDLAALDDYFAAADDPQVGASARKAAALVLERRWDVNGARALLDSLDPADPDVLCARARLDRRARGEPVVLLRRADSGVMDDTLTRRAQPLYYHGYCGLVVREVGYLGSDRDLWVDKLLSAGTEFVQVLGALRDVIGEAVFALRTISRPHRQIPERGSVTVTLLARVSASDEDECRARALQLWTDIHAVLPLAQENIYAFEPVVEADELESLLAPFGLTHAAEIARVQFDADGQRAAYPFLPGSVDLHNLHWALLRQSAPAMISIHLKPTNLLPWERPSLDAADDPAFSEGGYLLALNAERRGRNPMRALLYPQPHPPLNPAAYLLRIYAAGGAGASQLLPEIAAAALFEPPRDGGASYCIERAASPQDIDVIARNLAALDVESWGSEVESGRSSPQGTRLRYLVGELEAAQVFRLPIPNAEGVPGMALLEGRPVVPPAGMPQISAPGSVRLGVSVARMKGVPLPITQAEEDRRRHLYVVGKTGMGKSTLLLSLIGQDIAAGRGAFLLDPHGDLCDDVLARIPDYRRDDVILLDPSDSERPVGLNILDAETEADRHRVVNEFIGLLARMYDPHNQAIVGPIFQQNVRNAMLAAMSLPDGGTLIDVYRLLADGQYIRRVLPHLKDPLVRSYWEDVAARVDVNASVQWKAEMLPYVLSKFSRFVEDSTLRRMIGQSRTSIPWSQVMDEGKILLVNLAKGRIGQENAQFIGSLVLSSVLQAAFRRGEIPAARRRDFHIYIDEVQNYATPLLGTMLSEGRKFGVVLTIANQFLHQLDNGIREAVFGNVGSMVAFRVGAQDAPALAPEFFPVFSSSDLLNLPQFTACVKLLVDGMAARPFTMRTLPAMAAPNAERAQRIRERSRQRYGTDIQDVQQEILRRF